MLLLKLLIQIFRMTLSVHLLCASLILSSCLIAGGIYLTFLGMFWYGQHEEFQFMKSAFSPPLFVTLQGTITTSIGWYGWVATSKEERDKLLRYSWVLVILSLVELYYISIYLQNEHIIDELQSALSEKFDASKTDAKALEFFSSFQRSMECCGLSGYKDLSGLEQLHQSCCQVVSIECNPYPTGCINALETKTHETLSWISRLTIWFIIIKVSAAVWGFGHAYWIKESKSIHRVYS